MFFTESCSCKIATKFGTDVQFQLEHARLSVKLPQTTIMAFYSHPCQNVTDNFIFILDFDWSFVETPKDWQDYWDFLFSSAAPWYVDRVLYVSSFPLEVPFATSHAQVQTGLLEISILLLKKANPRMYDWRYTCTKKKKNNKERQRREKKRKPAFNKSFLNFKTSCSSTSACDPYTIINCQLLEIYWSSETNTSEPEVFYAVPLSLDFDASITLHLSKSGTIVRRISCNIQMIDKGYYIEKQLTINNCIW